MLFTTRLMLRTHAPGPAAQSSLGCTPCSRLDTQHEFCNYQDASCVFFHPKSGCHVSAYEHFVLRSTQAGRQPNSCQLPPCRTHASANAGHWLSCVPCLAPKSSPRAHYCCTRRRTPSCRTDAHCTTCAPLPAAPALAPVPATRATPLTRSRPAVPGPGTIPHLANPFAPVTSAPVDLTATLHMPRPCCPIPAVPKLATPLAELGPAPVALRAPSARACSGPL